MIIFYRKLIVIYLAPADSQFQISTMDRSIMLVVISLPLLTHYNPCVILRKVDPLFNVNVSLWSSWKVFWDVLGRESGATSKDISTKNAISVNEESFLHRK